jgi:hypothetical protein
MDRPHIEKGMLTENNYRGKDQWEEEEGDSEY